MKPATICLTLLVLVFQPCPAATKAKEATKRARPVNVTKALQRRIAKFTIRAPLKEVLAKIAKAGRISIVVSWSALERVGIKPTDEVAVSASKAKVSQLLDLATGRADRNKSPLAWYVDRGVVRVTTQMNVLYRNRLREVLARPRSGPATVRGRDFQFNGVSLKKVIDHLTTVSGANIAVNWKSLADEGILPETPIRLRVSKVSISRMLDLVMDQLNGGRDKLQRVYWVVDSGVVTIATGAALNTKLRVRIVNVSDLLMGSRRVEAPPNFTLRRSGNRGDSRESGQDGWLGPDNDSRRGSAPSRKQVQETLIGLIKDTIGEDMWQPAGKGSIRILRGRLVISQTQLGFKLMDQVMGGR